MSELQEDEKECPMCAEVVKALAIKCKHCGSNISSARVGQRAMTQLTSASQPELIQEKSFRKLNSEPKDSRVPESVGRLFISADLADLLPSMVKSELSSMSRTKQEEFLEEYNRKAKSVGASYVLWLLLGWHYIYLGKWGMQILFWPTGGGFACWWLIDAFRLPGLVRDYNKDVATRSMQLLKAVLS